MKIARGGASPTVDVVFGEGIRVAVDLVDGGVDELFHGRSGLEQLVVGS